MGKINSKQKGKRGELELAHWLTERGHQARRGQQFKGSPDSPDIICPSLGHLHIECKRSERFNAYKALAQANEDKDSSQVGVVFHRSNDNKWLCVVDADDFINLLDKSTS